MTERRTRVLLVAPLPPPVGGIATWTQLLLRTPTEPDIERIHVNTSVGRGYGATASPSRLFRQLSLSFRVCWRIATSRPDVVHVTTSYKGGWKRDNLFLALARFVGARTIANLRGGDIDEMYNAMPPSAQVAFMRQLQACDALVPITQANAHFLRELGLTNVELIPNCIDIRDRSPHPAPRSSPMRWLFVGYVTTAKGIEAMLDALRARPDATLTLVGPIVVTEGRSGAELLAAANRDPALRDRVVHVDAVQPDSARDVYPQHDIFVFPTRREGFPNAVLEAMEAGLPVVATRVGAIPDMIVDGEHGLLSDLGDQRALEAAIDRVTSDPALAARLGAAARERATALYDVKAVSATWCRLYRTLAHRAPAPSNG